MKNRQNAISTPSKRKATEYEAEDLENVDPTFFGSPKRGKALDYKPYKSILTNARSSAKNKSSISLASAPVVLRVRQIVAPCSPRKITAPIKSPLSAPAGRSPPRTQSGRTGLLNQRRSGCAFTRIDPPTFAGSKSSLSIDAALKGTVTGYAQRTSGKAAPEPPLAAPKASWFFEIYQDTVEDLLANANLKCPSTSTLEGSDDDAEDTEKENVPPMDDQSQTGSRTPGQSHQGSTRIDAKVKEEDACDVDRSPLGELSAEDFYDDGLDANSTCVFEDDVYEET